MKWRRSNLFRISLSGFCIIVLAGCTAFSSWKNFYDAGVRAKSINGVAEQEDEMYRAAVNNARTFGVPFSEYRPALVELAHTSYERRGRKAAENVYLELLEGDLRDKNLNAQIEDLHDLETMAWLQHENERALSYSERGLEIVTKAHGKGSADWCDQLMAVARMNVCLNRPKVATEQVNEVFHSAIKPLSVMDVERLRWLQADAALRDGDLKKAAGYYRQCLESRASRIGESDLSDSATLDVLMRYVGVEHKLGEEVEAKRAESLYGPKLDHLGTSTVMSRYKFYLQQFDRLDLSFR